MGDFTKPASEYASTELVKAHVRQAAEMVAAHVSADYRDEMAYRLASSDGGWQDGSLEFDSPLEAVFWVWWRAALRCNPLLRDAIMLRRHEFVTVEEQTYNVDFVIASRRGLCPWPLVGIELDGHAFHETSLEQVTYRNQRDRVLQRAGWHIFHFSFSEFTADPERGVWEVLDFIQAQMRELYRANAGAHHRDGHIVT